MLKQRANHQAIARFALNELGRDYAVGDIHGEFSLVEQAMQAAGFDPSRDRLFCVGDLIDRGTESHLAARFLAKPAVFAIQGNHDAELIDIARGPRAHIPKLLEIACRELEKSWWFELDAQEREDIVAALERLPLAIEIQTHDGLACLVHAEPSPGQSWTQFSEKLAEGDSSAVESALWGRRIAEDGAINECSDVWRIFVGHTPAPDGPMKFENMFCIDTGAVFGKRGFDPKAHLTMVQVDAPESAILGGRTMQGLVQIIARSPDPKPEPTL